MKSLTTFAMFAGLLMFTALGCTGQSETDSSPAGQNESAEPADDAHDDHEGEHDHDHDHDEESETTDET